jgi:hypothetical protein
LTGYFPGGIQLEENIGFTPEPVLHFFGEYFIESLEEVSLYPTIYIKSDLIQTQAEVLVRAEWHNLLSAGIGYRGFGNSNQDAVLLSAGVRLSPKFFLYYGFDIGLSHLNVAHEGTHELLIKYNLGEMIGAGPSTQDDLQSKEPLGQRVPLHDLIKLRLFFPLGEDHHDGFNKHFNLRWLQIFILYI